MPKSLIKNSSIPHPLRKPIKMSINLTSQTGNEHTFPFCISNKTGKLFGGKITEGDSNSVQTLGCPVNTLKVGDFHTHPNNDTHFGTMPSGADSVENMIESKEYNNKQFSCIASPISKNIHCFSPKDNISEEKMKRYENVVANLNRSGNIDMLGKLDFIEKHESDLANDFQHVYYNKSSFKKSKISDKQVVNEALGEYSMDVFTKVLTDESNIDKACNVVRIQSDRPNNMSITEICKVKIKS